MSAHQTADDCFSLAVGGAICAKAVCDEADGLIGHARHDGRPRAGRSLVSPAYVPLMQQSLAKAPSWGGRTYYGRNPTVYHWGRNLRIAASNARSTLFPAPLGGW